jgi:hypothetical protein
VGEGCGDRMTEQQKSHVKNVKWEDGEWGCIFFSQILPTIEMILRGHTNKEVSRELDNLFSINTLCDWLRLPLFFL